MPFWFLRHGETEYNARGLSHGAIDVDLNDTGRAQAKAAGAALADQGIVSIVCSPMLRTRNTAAIVNEVLGLPISYEPDLREVVFGGMEGKSLSPWFREWLYGNYTPDGAESFAELQARVGAALENILALPGPVLIVAHGGVFRAMRNLMGLIRGGITPNGLPLYCEPTEAGWAVKNADQALLF